MEVCPHCHRPYAPELQVSGPVRRRVVDLISARPDGITRDELHRLVYAEDPNGGPQPNCLSVIILKANAQLKPQGYRIMVSWMGRGARYQLVKLDAYTVRQPARDPHHREVARSEPAIEKEQHR